MAVLNKVPDWAKELPKVADDIDQLGMTFYCCNCRHKGETRFITPNFGPFCKVCLLEIIPLLQPDVALRLL